MLIIEVTNSRDLVRQRIGRLGERLIGRVVDAEAQVEKVLIQELETAFTGILDLSARNPLAEPGTNIWE